MKSFYFKGQRKLQSVMGGGAWRSGLVAASTLTGLFSLPVSAQQAAPGTPVVVQPGASGHPMLMPGMLTPKQMEALKKAKGAEFDQLFLTGMIQHHNGALIMVKDLFDTAGSGQDAELFNFSTDVDSGQRAEIRIMQTMLEGAERTPVQSRSR